MREITNYDSMHKKLKRIRGRAKDYMCIDCNESQAHHWSLNHDVDPTTILFQKNGREMGRMFSTDIWAYQPRCAKCHSKHDSDNGLERAPSGVKNTVETYCTLPGCDRPHHAKGLCDPHYRKEQRRKRNERGR